MAPNRDPRPARTLIIFFLTFAVLCGLAALGGTWKPRLGLDLEGGTRITLSALEGSAVTRENLQQAQTIIDQRVNGTGVTEAEVSTQGDRNIIVEIPGENRSDIVDTVARTAQLRFRIVAGAAPGRAADQPPAEEPSASPSEGASESPAGSPSPEPSEPAPSETAQPGDDATEGEGAPAPAQDQSTPRPRPVPLAEPSETPAPSESQSATPSEAPAEEPAQEPGQQEAQGDPTSPEGALAFAANPPERWQQRFAEFTCPPPGEALPPSSDNPERPLVACDEDGNKFLLSAAVIEGTELRTASFGIPQNDTQYAVQLSFRASARETFGTVTSALNQNGGQFAIVLDGTVLSAPGVQQPILDGNAQITGDFTEAEARSLSNSLKFGALPIRFAEPSVETVGPSLAGNQLSAGITAGAAGLLIVMIYCLGYYRGLGLVVIASLVISALMTYAAVLVLAVAAGFALTLPGIAGLIVGVGITADSFIIYFERIRDEMRDGKSMRVAVELGWARARMTCLAADAVSLLAAVVLYIFAIGVVRGFAFALGISTLIDIIIFFFFTKPLMTIFARWTFFNSGGRWSGLSASSLGLDGEPSTRPREREMAGGA